MAAPYVFTFADALARVDAFLSYAGVGANQYLRREVIRDSYREVIAARDWSFLRSIARIALHAPQTTGTVSFDLTGGSYERQLTLSGDGATWPTWAEDAAVRLDDPPIVCDIDERKSDTVVTLDAMMAPTSDVSSTDYSVYPRWYRLPNDFASMARPMGEDEWTVPTKVSKEEIEQLNRYVDTTGSIEKFAIGAPLDLYGAMALYIHPPIDTDETLDLPYNRMPRDLVYSGYDDRDNAGTISVTAGSQTVTGSSTSFAAGMVGAILWIGTDTTYRPDGISGQYPYAEQRSIYSVESTTSLTLDQAVAASATNVRYRITDPIDLDVVLYDAFLRCCEKNLGSVLRLKNRAELEARWIQALTKAKEADCRAVQPRVAGPRRGRISRLTDSSHRSIVGFS